MDYSNVKSRLEILRQKTPKLKVGGKILYF